MSQERSAAARALNKRGLVTADQLLAMGDGRRELIHGEVIEMTPPGEEHEDIASEMFGHLWTFVRQHKLGKVYSRLGFLLATDPDIVREPDTTFVRRERVVRTPKYFPGAPDIAVEVLSPGDTASESNEKAEMWLAHGTREVWVADPRRRTVQIFRPGRAPQSLTEPDAIESGDLLPGFRLPVRDIFPSP